MKRNKTLLCLLIATAFIIPLFGGNAVSDSRAQKIYHFNDYDTNEAWETNPQYMVDGDPDTYASTTDDTKKQRCNETNCSGTDLGGIIRVEIRTKGYYSGGERDICLTPWFTGTEEGDDHIFDAPDQTGLNRWSDWFDITDDSNSHTFWNWTYIDSLDVKVKPSGSGTPFTLYCSIVEIRVTYNPE